MSERAEIIMKMQRNEKQKINPSKYLSKYIESNKNTSSRTLETFTIWNKLNFFASSEAN